MMMLKNQRIKPQYLIHFDQVYITSNANKIKDTSFIYQHLYYHRSSIHHQEQTNQINMHPFAKAHENKLSRDALSLYRKLLRLGHKWKYIPENQLHGYMMKQLYIKQQITKEQEFLSNYKSESELDEEANYILSESKKEFRANRRLQDEKKIEEKIREGHQRIELAEHYKVPWPRHEHRINIHDPYTKGRIEEGEEEFTPSPWQNIQQSSATMSTAVSSTRPSSLSSNTSSTTDNKFASQNTSTRRQSFDERRKQQQRLEEDIDEWT